MIIFHLFHLFTLHLLLTTPLFKFSLVVSAASMSCSFPEGNSRICYNTASSSEAESQNVSVSEIEFIAKYLRSYQAQRGKPKFYFMNGTGADDCAEWPVTSRGRTAVFAKLLGDQYAAVAFLDICEDS